MTTPGKCAALALWVCALTSLGEQLPGKPVEITKTWRLNHHWTSGHGLPQSPVQCLLQTHDGYVWIGARNGLARFDGLRFTVFNRGTTKEITNEDCRLLCEDSDRRLWVLTAGDLLLWHGGQFHSLDLKSQSAFQNEEIEVMIPAQRRGVWLAAKKTIAHYDATKFTVIPTEHLRGTRIHALCEDAEGKLWAGTDAPDLTTNSPPLVHTDGAVRFEVKARCLLQDRNGKMWWGNDSMHSFTAGELRHFSLAEGFKGKLVRSLHLSRDGVSLTIVTEPSPGVGGPRGLHRLEDNQFHYLPLSEFGFENDILCGLEDREGNLLAGTRNDGLLSFHRPAIKAITAKDGLLRDRVNCVYQSDDGIIQVGTSGGWWQIADQTPSPAQARLPRYPTHAIIQGSDGMVWVAHRPWPGVFDAEVMHGAAPDYVMGCQGHEIHLLANNIVHALGATPGAIWIGQAEGVSRVPHGPDGPKPVLRFTMREGLPANDVRVILGDSLSNIWFGTHGGGLSRRQGESFQNFSRKDGLSSDFIRTLYFDSSGVLWIGSDNGITRLKNGRFTPIAPTRGPLSGHINQILEDDLGFLWIGCADGIWRIATSDLNLVADGNSSALRAVRFTEADGLPSEQISSFQPGACKLENGELWFPTAKGIAIIDPRRVQLNNVAPKVLIEKVITGKKIFLGDQMAAERRDKLVDGGVRGQTAATFEPGFGRILEFHYTANTFSAPELTRFEYRLAGLDTDWQIDSNNRRVAFYTDLPHGNYSFRVRAFNHHGVQSESTAEFAFSIAPHFYETWAFYALVFSIFMASAGGIHFWRLSFARRIHALEREQALNLERARIGRDIHDDIGSRLSQLSILQELAHRGGESSDAARSHFEKLRATTTQTFQALNEIVWAVNPKQDSLAGLIDFLRIYASDFLSPAGIRVHFDLPNPSPEIRLGAEARHDLFMVIKEALNNTLKHSSASEVSLRLLLENGNLRIVIEDDGVGPRMSTLRPRNGNGLANMERRVQGLGGQLKIGENASGGTSLILSVPIGRISIKKP